jgi:hypothetical protein
MATRLSLLEIIKLANEVYTNGPELGAVSRVQRFKRGLELPPASERVAVLMRELEAEREDLLGFRYLLKYFFTPRQVLDIMIWDSKRPEAN